MNFAYHCSEVLRYFAIAKPCPEAAVVVYVRPDGSREGRCARHREEGEQLARALGWVVDAPALAAAA